LPNSVFNQPTQELAKTMLVAPHELRGGVGGVGKFGSGGLEGAASKSWWLEPLLEGGEESSQPVLRLFPRPIHRRAEELQHTFLTVLECSQDQVVLGG